MRKKGIQILDSTFGILLYAPPITVCHGPCVWFCAFLNFRYFIKKKGKKNLYKVKYKMWTRLFIFIKKKKKYKYITMLGVEIYQWDGLFLLQS